MEEEEEMELMVVDEEMVELPCTVTVVWLISYQGYSINQAQRKHKPIMNICSS